MTHILELSQLAFGEGNEDLHIAFVWGNSPYMHLGSLVCSLHQNNKIYVHLHMFNKTL